MLIIARTTGFQTAVTNGNSNTHNGKTERSWVVVWKSCCHLRFTVSLWSKMFLVHRMPMLLLVLQYDWELQERETRLWRNCGFDVARQLSDGVLRSICAWLRNGLRHRTGLSFACLLFLLPSLICVFATRTFKWPIVFKGHLTEKDLLVHIWACAV